MVDRIKTISIEEAKKLSIDKWNKLFDELIYFHKKTKERCGFCIRHKLGENISACRECEVEELCRMVCQTIDYHLNNIKKAILELKVDIKNIDDKEDDTR